MYTFSPSHVFLTKPLSPSALSLPVPSLLPPTSLCSLLRLGRYRRRSLQPRRSCLNRQCTPPTPSTAPPRPMLLPLATSGRLGPSMGACARHGRALASAAPPFPTEQDAEHHQRFITPFRDNCYYRTPNIWLHYYYRIPNISFV